MGKKNRGKLGLKKDTLRRLDVQELSAAAGGYIYNFQIVDINYAYSDPRLGSIQPAGAWGTKFTYTCTCTG